MFPFPNPKRLIDTIGFCLFISLKDLLFPSDLSLLVGEVDEVVRSCFFRVRKSFFRLVNLIPVKSKHVYDR